MGLAARAPQGLEDTPPEIALRRLARAEELGMSYREYTLEILGRGRHLWRGPPHPSLTSGAARLADRFRPQSGRRAQTNLSARRFGRGA